MATKGGDCAHVLLESWGIYAFITGKFVMKPQFNAEHVIILYVYINCHEFACYFSLIAHVLCARAGFVWSAVKTSWRHCFVCVRTKKPIINAYFLSLPGVIDIWLYVSWYLSIVAFRFQKVLFRSKFNNLTVSLFVDCQSTKTDVKKSWRFLKKKQLIEANKMMSWNVKKTDPKMLVSGC